jgi:hypothetical protein
MRVQITRRGGLAGIPLSLDTDTRTFDQKIAEQLDVVLQELVTRHEKPRLPPHPDAFEYDIVLPDLKRTTRLGESELPPQLQPLLQELKRHGNRGSPPR